MSVIIFQFKNGELYMSVNGSECSFTDFSNQTWNDSMRELMVFGVQRDTLTKCAERYGKIMSDTKRYAIPYGEFGIRIIREITRIATAHLTFVMAKSQELQKHSNGKSRFVKVNK